MEIKLTLSAHEFVQSRSEASLTVSSVVFSSCCSGPLPPEVKPGAPADGEGFHQYTTAEGLTVFFDSLLDPRREIVIDVKDYGSYRELFIVGWE